MHRMHTVHSFDQCCTDLLIGCGDGGRRRPQCPVDVLGIPAREQNMLEVGCPELREYWGSSGEQSFCISNAMECWVCELLVDGDTGAVAQKEGAPTVSADVCSGVDVDSIHALHWPVTDWIGSKNRSSCDRISAVDAVRSTVAKRMRCPWISTVSSTIWPIAGCNNNPLA